MTIDAGNRLRAIAVLGAGAIGCFVGGMLRAVGNRVVFIGRPGTAEAWNHAA